MPISERTSVVSVVTFCLLFSSSSCGGSSGNSGTGGGAGAALGSGGTGGIPSSGGASGFVGAGSLAGSNGAGATGSGGAGGAGSAGSTAQCLAGGPGDQMISSFGSSDVQQFCTHVACVLTANTSDYTKMGCIGEAQYAVEVAGTSCSAGYDPCMAGAPVKPSVMCGTVAAGECSVTVAQYDSCMSDTIAALHKVVNTFNCDDLGAGLVGLASVTPASCGVVHQNCRALEPPGAAN